MSRFLLSKAAAKITLLLMTVLLVGYAATICELQGFYRSFLPAVAVSETTQRQVFGTASLDRRLTNGTVTLISEAGRTTVPLTDLGSFHFPARAIPLPASIVVETVTEGHPVILEAELVDQAPGAVATFSVQVNILSTLAARYHRRHPDLSLTQAEAKVLQGLGIEGLPHSSLGLNHPHASFIASKFLNFAKSTGGINPAMDQVLTAIDKPQTRTTHNCGGPDMNHAGLAFGLAPARLSYQTAILPYPPVNLLGQDFTKLFSPGLATYPTLPDGLMFDFKANRMWEFAAHGPLSLSQARSLASSYQLAGCHWRLPGQNELRAMWQSLIPRQRGQFAVISTDSTEYYRGYVWTASDEVFDTVRGNDIRAQIIYRFETDEFSSVGPIFTGTFSDGVEEPQLPGTRTPMMLPTLLVADVDSALYNAQISLTLSPSPTPPPTTQGSSLLPRP